jgi:hypothetical protein
MVQQPQGPREQGEAKTMARASTWTPSLVQKERYASLEKLANFLGREYVDLVQVCAHMLARTAYRDVEVAEKIQTLQGEKSARLRQFAARLAVDLDREIRELDQHPMRGSPAMAEKLETKRRERRDLALLLKIVFNLSLSEAIAAQGETPLAPR